MPQYLVEYTLGGVIPEALRHTGAEGGAEVGVVSTQSYLSVDGHRAFCVYEAPSPEAIRRVATRALLPLARITQVAEPEEPRS